MTYSLAETGKGNTIKVKMQMFGMPISILPSLCCDEPNVRDFLARKTTQSRIWRVESAGVSLETYKLNMSQV